MDSLNEFKLYATGIQIGELEKTPDLKRRNQLSEVFHKIKPGLLPTDSCVWDVSSWEECKWGEGNIYAEILKNLELRQRNPTAKHASNIKDALVAETAIKQNLTLITADSFLAEVIELLGGTVVDFRKL